jgi:hypothetical protein
MAVVWHDTGQRGEGGVADSTHVCAKAAENKPRVSAEHPLLRHLGVTKLGSSHAVLLMTAMCLFNRDGMSLAYIPPELSLTTLVKR